MFSSKTSILFGIKMFLITFTMRIHLATGLTSTFKMTVIGYVEWRLQGYSSVVSFYVRLVLQSYFDDLRDVLNYNYY